MADWQKLIPEAKGTLPGGNLLRRTDPSGNCDTGIAFLGAYPAATKVRARTVDGQRINLPAEVERVSFEPRSESGREFESHYLKALGLVRDDVMVTDMLPYYLANTSVSKSGRSMARNVAMWERANHETGIEKRLPSPQLVEFARGMPGNMDRLRSYFGECSPKLLLTLGTESAAFVRGVSFEEARAMGEELFYARPAKRTFAGLEMQVVHLVHPHMFIKRIKKWTAKHERWCAGEGKAIICEHVAGLLRAGRRRTATRSA
jgi:hypothetical protein